jgi:predicted phosphodiesterase
MGKGIGSGAGRPRLQVPSGSELLQKILGTKDQTKSIRELAADYGVSVDTIRRRLNEHGTSNTGENSKTSPSRRVVIPSTIAISASQEGVPEPVIPTPEFCQPIPPPAAEPAAAAAPPVAEPEDNGAALFFEEDYTYNRDSDTYITFLDSAPKPILMPGVKHRAMVRAYSNWDGQPSTINEICRQFDFPRQWFHEYKQVHGWTHDKEPFTDEEVRDRPTGELVEESLQMKRQSLFRKFAKREWQETQVAAEKWWDFEQSVMQPLFEHISNNAPRYQPALLDLKPSTNPFAVIFAAFDIHYGKGAWRDETGESFSRQECHDLLMHHTAALGTDVARYGWPERIIVPIGSDWFHVDNGEHETSHGTRQDMDGTFAQMLMEGTELAVEYIDYLRQIAPVTMIAVDGNHDRAASLTMAMYVRAWFRQSEDVTCIVQPTPRQYAEYGNTLLGFCHGDSMKVAQLAGMMASEAREAWGRTQNRAWFTGHLHHEVVRELDGIVQYQLPSLSAVDRWHKRSGFCLSKRALTAYVVDKVEGPIATLISPVQKDIPFGFKMPGDKYISAAA